MTGAIWFVIIVAGLGGIIVAPGVVNRLHRRWTFYRRQELEESDILKLFPKELYDPEKVLFCWKSVADTVALPWSKLRSEDTLDQHLRGWLFDPFAADFGVEIQELRHQFGIKSNGTEAQCDVYELKTVEDLVRTYARK